MKIAILNDTHFGVRNGNRIFEAELLKFLKDVFFPYIDNNQIKCVVVAGDLFDDRRSILVRSMNAVKTHFLDELEKRGINVFFIPGNHDIVYKNTITPNSLQPILENYQHLKYVGTPTDLEVDGVHMLLVPWICAENEETCLYEIANSKADILVSHMDIYGSQHVPGIILTHGFEPDMFKHFKRVLNGHIHCRSSFANVTNLGTQYQFTWADYGQQKGFHVLDSHTHQLEFIPNPSLLYDKFFYGQDLLEGIDPLEWCDINADRVKDKFLKIIVEDKQNRYLFEKFADKVSVLGAHEIQFIENFNNSIDEIELDENLIEQVKSTIHIINDFINEYDTKLDKPTLLKLINQLYTEALNKDVRE